MPKRPGWPSRPARCAVTARTVPGGSPVDERRRGSWWSTGVEGWGAGQGGGGRHSLQVVV
jgi:hypothetical protein